MNNLKPIIFLIPVIALVFTGILYFYFLKKATNKNIFKRLVFTITVIALLLNLIWELVQMPLYRDSSFTIGHIAFCALASVADALMVLLLYFGVALIFRNSLWIQHLKWQQIAIVILTGGTGAVLSEMRHLSSGSWAYDNSMPLIPVVNVGIAPVLQFMILPLIIYFLSFSRLKLSDKI
ncbi:hypothetical protein CAP36_12140 [Chitinophagaceae bacterium IBVUCB2]|nr:hypothetical protein CAP36_12140 [Chitinophagaceae bacterium IBVUCB2]